MSKLKPYPTYRPVQLNFADKLPDGWKTLRGKFVFKEINERSIDGKEQLLSVSEHKGVVPRDSINVNMFQAENYTGYKLCNPGDVVINSLWAWHRGIGVAENRGIVSTAYSVHRLRKPNEWNYKYLTYLLRTNAYVGEYLIRSKGIWDSRLQLTGSNFQDIQIVIPPLETQNAIVAYLDRKTQQIQEFIAKKERLIELLEEERREFIDKVTHELGGYKTHTKPLKYLVKFISEQTNKKEEDEQYIALENIESWTGKLDLSIGDSVFESSVKKFTDSDILFNKLRPYLAKVVIPDFKGVCVGEILVLRPLKEISREYLFYTLISRRFIDIVDSSTFGSKMPRASWDFIGKVDIAFPIDHSKQNEICEKIKNKELSISRLKSKYQFEIETIKEFQESLITQVVTGQLKVPTSESGLERLKDDRIINQASGNQSKPKIIKS